MFMEHLFSFSVLYMDRNKSQEQVKIKGITWIGNFDYQETFFYAPVDETIDANGFTQLPFNKGTMDVFKNFAAELKGRAQEWKREAEQLNKQHGDVKVTKIRVGDGKWRIDGLAAGR